MRIGIGVMSLLLTVVMGCGYAQSAIGVGRGILDIREHSKESKRNEERHAADMQERQERSDREKSEAQRREAERIAAEKEKNRPRRMTDSQRDDTAERVAAVIAAKLPQDDFIKARTRASGKKMVVFAGEVSNRAKFSEESDVALLQEKIVARLHDSTGFSEIFVIVVDRDRARKIREKAEGKDDTAIEGASDDVKGYQLDDLISIDLTFFDDDQIGTTSWETRFEVVGVKSRRILVKDGVKTSQ